MWTNYIRQKSSYFESSLREWLKMPINEGECVVRDDEGNIVTHEDYLRFFIARIESILQRNNYVIKNKNELKKDIYNFIYTLSDNSKNECT